MQAVGTIEDWLEKGTWNPCQKKRTKKEGRKSPVLANVESTVDIFPQPPFRYLEDADIEVEWLPFPTLPVVWCGCAPPWIFPRCGFTYRVK